MGKNIFKSILKAAPAIIATAVTGNPAIGAAVSGGTTLATGGNIGQAVGNAAGSYIGGEYLGGAGNVGPAGTVASGLGGIGLDSVANALPASIAGAGLSNIAGNYIGGNIGENLGGSLFDSSSQKKQPSTTASGPAPFSPTQAGQMALPPSLSQFGSLNPEQQSTNIATQGVYGGGEGPQENQYFLNLINRRLVDQNNNVGNLSSLQPIESSYLSQLGLGGYQNPTDLLKGISNYKQA